MTTCVLSCHAQRSRTRYAAKDVPLIAYLLQSLSCVVKKEVRFKMVHDNLNILSACPAAIKLGGSLFEELMFFTQFVFLHQELLAAFLRFVGNSLEG